MYHSKMMSIQLDESGLRVGDLIQIFPFHGHKKTLTLKSMKLDIVSMKHRPKDLSLQYLELPSPRAGTFHYRIETETQFDNSPRFYLKTIHGRPFMINGIVAKEAYVERFDKIILEESKLLFTSESREKLTKNFFEHEVLMDEHLIQSNLKILVYGETGSGKSHLAKKIHEKSLRRGDFVGVNLSSYNANLIESELFGHKKGSFTGAIADKQGAFSQAQYGTLFLDEIDSLPMEIQTKLLTFLDNNTFRKVGDTKEEKINTRLIFASGRKLEELVSKGLFRADLYYRLKSGYSLELKSLRMDISKIQDACTHFCLTHSVSISHRLVEFYQSYAWPGNLRQLLGHLEKKKILSRSDKLDFDIYDEELITQSSDLNSINEISEIVPFKDYKDSYLRKAINICDGNLSMAAKRLGVNPRMLKDLIHIA